MALIQTTLADELRSLAPTALEADAITTLTDAYANYAADATANSVALSPAGVLLGKAAMASALVGMSAAGAGIAAIPAAIKAFWVAVAGGLATSFAGATAIVPPPHASLSSAFATLMPTNTAGEVTADQAADSMALIMHADAILGGTVTFGIPTFPIV
jgi:hypothetical protein